MAFQKVLNIFKKISWKINWKMCTIKNGDTIIKLVVHKPSMRLEHKSLACGQIHASTSFQFAQQG